MCVQKHLILVCVFRTWDLSTRLRFYYNFVQVSNSCFNVFLLGICLWFIGIFSLEIDWHAMPNRNSMLQVYLGVWILVMYCCYKFLSLEALQLDSVQHLFWTSIKLLRILEITEHYTPEILDRKWEKQKKEEVNWIYTNTEQTHTHTIQPKYSKFSRRMKENVCSMIRKVWTCIKHWSRELTRQRDRERERNSRKRILERTY